MTGVLVWLAYVMVGVLVNEVLSRWRRTACTCGRSRWPYFSTRHYRHALMVTEAVLITVATVSFVLTLDREWAVGGSILTVYAWWCVKVHGSGKRRWPKRAAGLVKVNRHGRLVVVKS